MAGSLPAEPLVPVLAPDPWTVGTAFVAVGPTNTVGNVISQSLRQRP